MSLLNIGLSCLICLIYLHKQSDMCAYDSTPLWKYEIPKGVPAWDENNSLRKEGDDCNGEHGGWYYAALLIIHIYFLLDYILRLLTQKYMWNYFKSGESILDLVTMVPFLICISSLPRNNVFTQFFIMFDCVRLINYNRLM